MAYPIDLLPSSIQFIASSNNSHYYLEKCARGARPPQVRTTTFLSYICHIYCMSPGQLLGLCFVQQARPTQFSLICDFCSSDRDFAIVFFQIPPHDGHPCHSLTVRHYQALYGTFTHKLLPMLGTLKSSHLKFRCEPNIPKDSLPLSYSQELWRFLQTFLLYTMVFLNILTSSYFHNSTFRSYYFS